MPLYWVIFMFLCVSNLIKIFFINMMSKSQKVLRLLNYYVSHLPTFFFHLCGGHLWTIWGNFYGGLAPPPPPPFENSYGWP